VQADTIVMVLSPDAISSEVCKKEVTFAASLNKRFAPIVWRPVDDKAVPETLARLNFIFFDDDAQFDASANRLVEALATDIDWIRKHTQFGEVAHRWSPDGRPGPRGLLLRSPVLEEAEHWIASRPPGAPVPTDTTRAFILDSRRGATRRRNILTASLAAGLFLAVALSGLAYWQRGIAIEQRDEAIRQRNAALISQSHFLAQAADGLVTEGTTRAAIALLRVALPEPAANNDRPLVNDAMVSAYAAIAANLERGTMAMPPGATAVATDGAGRSMVIATPDTIVVRSGPTKAGERILAHNFGASARLVLAPDGTHLAMIARNGTVAIRDLTTNKDILRHAGEGVGTRAVFLNDGTRLLIMSPDQKTLHLLDAESGSELATRKFVGTHGQPFVAMVDPRQDIIAVITDGNAHRLSTENLTDKATFEIGESFQAAMTLSADGKLIYLAVAKGVMEPGQIIVLDSETLASQRTFGNVDTGAKHIAISPNSKLLAVHGLLGIDFYGVTSGNRLNKVVADTVRDAVAGRFLGGSTDSNYMAFGTSGLVRSYVPELGIVKASYRTIDGGAIEQIEALPDGTGFLTISDRPSVTSWAFDIQNSSLAYSVPFVLLGKNQRVPTPMTAFAVAADRKDVLATYADLSARRWNLENGTWELVRQAPDNGFALQNTPKAIEHAAALPAGLSALAERSGRILVYRHSGELAAEIAGEPLAYMAAAGSSQLFTVSKTGMPAIIDVSNPSRPKVTPVPALGACRAQVAVFDHTICINPDDTIRVLRVSDAKIVLEEPSSSQAKLGATFISEDGEIVAISNSRGDMVVKSTADGRIITRQKLSMTLRDDLLLRAAQTPLLSDDARTKIRSGAKEITVEIGPKLMAISPDRKLIAVSMPDSAIRIIDLQTGKIRDFAQPRASIQEMQFSQNGKLLSVTQVNLNGGSALMAYDVASGDPIASLSLGGQAETRQFTLPSGQGFFTIDKSGLIVVHPIFENPQDLIAYLAREFPERLTPEQRRAYFIE
jgi:WD40 repeat protein